MAPMGRKQPYMVGFYRPKVDGHLYFLYTSDYERRVDECDQRYHVMVMHNSELINSSDFRDQLLGFNEKVLRLEKTRFFNSPRTAFSLEKVPTKVLSVNQTGNESEGYSLTLELEAKVNDFGLHYFDRDNIEAFVLTYRMLTQRNDRYSIVQLAGGYGHVHPVFRNTFSHLRQQYVEFLSADSLLHPSGVALSHRDILDNVIYGELAHSNKQKAIAFRNLTRWSAHEKSLWFAFDHALRFSVEILQYFRDLNAAILMVYFAVPVNEKEIFKRLQRAGVIREDAEISSGEI